MASAPRKSAATTASTANPKPRTDWDAVERDYRTSQMTLREMASKYGCSHGRIAQRAKEQGWSRDLTGVIKQATDARLIEASVNTLLTSHANQATQDLTTVVLAAAEVNTQVIMGHRRGLSEIAQVKRQLLMHVQQAAVNLPELQEIIEMVRSPDDNGLDRLNDALKKALGRAALVDDLKKLAEVDERVRKGEREAFGLNDATSLPSNGQKRVVLEFVDVVPRCE